MTMTVNLGVNKIDVALAQKEVTANEAFDVFDAALSELAHTMTDANYTLSTSTTPQEWQYGTIKLTGTLTAGRNLIVPTNKKQYVVVNSTTGGFAITAKTSAGTGVAVVAGATAILRCDGANIVAVTLGSGSGDVVGPASATDNHMAVFDGVTGKLIKGGGVAPTGTNTGDQTSVSGNAGTATALQTARTIGGVSFNGTTNITQPFDVHAFYPGIPTASAKVVSVPVARAVGFVANFSGSYGAASAAATASTAFDVQKNGSSIGTITFAAAASTATFTTTAGAAQSLAAGDVISIIAPASPDATLADPGFVLAGTR